MKFDKFKLIVNAAMLGGAMLTLSACDNQAKKAAAAAPAKLEGKQFAFYKNCVYGAMTKKSSGLGTATRYEGDNLITDIREGIATDAKVVSRFTLKLDNSTMPEKIAEPDPKGPYRGEAAWAAVGAASNCRKDALALK